ncbi:UvrD-helicase domain-containing protein [Marinobacter sp. P4B1]|uniref:UvrD-helicase domain-containing protein n=1 Tax=Marinobacter sp. P4B1 TaxID=1119533 RepID=UPI00071C8181|nr:UvrD-helicase domain-containing protein [Marinobacter sp. P4B1]KRW83718.1 hypothetical protein AQ621_16850 [Marinobacter sp. P4B1]
MALTEEQIEFIYAREPKILVRAFAGSGKTFSASAFSKARPASRILYLVFNNAAQRDAKHRFPSNVQPRTINSLAYSAFGRIYRDKHADNLTAQDVRAAVDPVGEMNYRSLMVIAETVRQFMISRDEGIRPVHAEAAIPEDSDVDPDHLAKIATRLWDAMIDPAQTRVRATHDTYLKLFQLQRPDFSRQFDILIVDEAQDVNPVTQAIIDDQQLPVVLIGDPHQSIYGFRGAVNAIEGFAYEAEYPLTYSFRFGFECATLANMLLQKHTTEEEMLIGAGPDTKILYDTPLTGPHMRIHRTVAETLKSAADAVRKGQKIAWAGNIHGYGLDKAMDLFHLYSGDRRSIRDFRLIKEFPSYDRYKEAASDSKNAEMMRLTRIVEEYGADMPSLVDAMRTNTTHANQADLILTTAHKSKGLQAPNVELANDFPDLDDKRLEGDKKREEVNLLYVAMTRAQTTLSLPDNIRKHIFA